MIPRVLLVSALAVAALVLLPAAPAEACCTPCSYLCKTAPPSTYCCSGIPEPGNACGFMTCREYLGGPILEAADLTAQPEWMTLSVTSNCVTQATDADTDAEAPKAEATETETAEG